MVTRFLMILGSLLLFVACEKGAGEGGTSTITGSVIVQEWDKDFIAKRSEHPARAEDVYIIYGDDDFYGDNVETHYDGTYQFVYLREGKYTIYVYSKDPQNPSDKKIVSTTIEISGRKQTVEVPELVIINDNGADGIYSIQGNVIVEQYSSNFETKRNEHPAQEVDVYLQRANEDFYFDRVRTDANGFFKFSDLIEDDYTVFVYSENPELAKEEKSVISQTISVVSGQTVTGDADPLVFVADDFMTMDNEGDKGYASIKGVIWKEEWNGTFTIKRDEYPGFEENVYVQRVGDEFYIDRVDTDFDGRYTFSDLNVGQYVVYAYSKIKGVNYDITNRKAAIKDTVEITLPTETVVADTITIIN